MKTKFFSIIAIIAAISFTSCKDNYQELTHHRVAVRFSSNVNSAIPAVNANKMRAPGVNQSSFAADARTGIFMVNATPAVVDGNANKQYKATGTNDEFIPVNANDSIFYPVNGNTVNFIAYSPFDATSDLNVAYNINVSNQSVAGLDLLYAKTTAGYNKKNTTVELTFNHVLSHIVINTKSGEGITQSDLDGMTVKISGLKTENTMDMTTGALGIAAATADITPNTLTTGKKFDAILIPQTISANVVTVTFNVAGEDFIWKLDAGSLVQATEYIYNITITRRGLEITGVINDWTAGTGGTIEVD
jgi:hypothetical protein